MNDKVVNVGYRYNLNILNQTLTSVLIIQEG